MSITITFGGTNYTWPSAGGVDWSANVLSLVQALASKAAIKAITGGSAATTGSATLTGGTVTVTTTALATSGKVLLQLTAEGGTPGRLRVSTKTVGTSFVVTSSSGTDTSTFDWVIVNV